MVHRGGGKAPAALLDTLRLGSSKFKVLRVNGGREMDAVGGLAFHPRGMETGRAAPATPELLLFFPK